MNFKFFQNWQSWSELVNGRGKIELTWPWSRRGGEGTKIKWYIQSILQVYSFQDCAYEKLKSRSVHIADKLTPVFWFHIFQFSQIHAACVWRKSPLNLTFRKIISLSLLFYYLKVCGLYSCINYSMWLIPFLQFLLFNYCWGHCQWKICCSLIF